MTAAGVDLSDVCWSSGSTAIVCADGSSAPISTGLDPAWSTCGDVGSSRVQCPSAWPYMCSAVEPGLGGNPNGDRRCSQTVADCGNHGGVRACAAAAAVTHLTPGDYDWTDTGTPVSFSAFQPGTIATPPPGKTSRCAWMSWQVQGGWDDMACDSQMGYVCKAPMSATGKECTVAPPTPPSTPPGSGKTVAGCGLDTFNDRMNSVSATCCDTGGSDCAGGTPTECSAACSEVWIPFMSDCGSFVATTGLGDAFGSFSTKCNAATRASASAGCTFATVMPILGSCLVLGTDEFCSGTCFTQTDSFLSQCRDSGGLLATYVPQLQAALDECPPPPPPALPPSPAPGDPFATCDISAMNSVCNGFSVTSVNGLCTSQCVQLIRLFYPACSTSPGSAQFLTSVQPYIDQCGTGQPTTPPPPAPEPAGQYTTCNIDHMNEVCNGFTITSPDELCQSDCIQEILNYYPACSSTPGNENFLASVQPYVVQCSGTSTETCDVPALNAACVSFTPPANSDLDTLCAEPCIANLVSNFEACSIVPELAQFADTMREVVIPCRSHGQERMCWNLLDEFHHNTAGCCDSPDSCDTMPITCSAQCAEFFMPYFSSCAPFLFDGDMAQEMETFNRVCAESTGRTNVYNSEPTDTCAALSCSQCSGQCGWCSTRGGVCSSECTTTPGECDAHNFENADPRDGSQGSDDIDSCASMSTCNTCVSGGGHVACDWCAAGGINVCSGQCPGDAIIMAHGSTLDQCNAFPVPVQQRPFAVMTVGARATTKHIRAGATLYLQFTASEGQTYDILSRRISVAGVHLSLLDVDLLTRLASAQPAPNPSITWTCTADGVYGIQVTAGSQSDAGQLSISVSDAGDACGQTLGLDGIPGVKYTEKTSGTIHFSAHAGDDTAVNQQCRWNIKCPSETHQATPSVVSIDFTALNTELDRDFIEIDNADPQFSSVQRITRLSGQLDPHQRPVISRNANMVVKFSSDAHDGGDEGFTAHFHCGGAVNKQSTAVVPGAGFVQGAITAADPQAWFSFTSNPGTTYQIITEGLTLLTTQVFVYQNDGVTQIEHGPGSIEYTVPAGLTGASTTFQVMISAGDPSQTGTFQIQIVEGINPCVAPRRIDGDGDGPGTITFGADVAPVNSTCTWRIDCNSITRLHVNDFASPTYDTIDIYNHGSNALGQYTDDDHMLHLSGNAASPALDIFSPIGAPLVVVLGTDFNDGESVHIDYSCCIPTDNNGGVQCAGPDGHTVQAHVPPPPSPTASGHHTPPPPPTLMPPPPAEYDWADIAMNEDTNNDFTGSVDAVITRTAPRSYYQFEATRGTQYTIEATITQMTDANMVLYDADGTTQLDDVGVTRQDPGGPGSNAITWSCVSTGQYRLLITGTLGSTLDTATVSVVISSQGTNPACSAFNLNTETGVNMPGGTTGIISDDQQHSLNFGADSDPEACQWTLQCNPAGGAPGLFLTMDITRLATTGGFVKAFNNVVGAGIQIPIGGKIQPFTRAVAASDTPVRVQSDTGVLRFQFENSITGTGYRGFSVVYSCLSTAQPTDAPATPQPPPAHTLADQCATLTETFHTACCDDGLPFTTCFRGDPVCSQTCASHFLPFQQQCQSYISRLHMDFLTPFRHLSDLCPLQSPPPPPPPATLPPVTPPVIQPGLTPVTFQVDFSQAPGVVNMRLDEMHSIVTVNGDFNSWCGPTDGVDPALCKNYMQPRFSDGTHQENPNIFLLTKLLPAGEYSYLYSMDGFMGQIEDLSECGGHDASGLGAGHWTDASGRAHVTRKLTIAGGIPQTVRSAWGKCGTELVTEPPPPPPLPSTPPPPAAICGCQDAWQSAGVSYQGCAQSPLGNWCLVRGSCNGAHTNADGSSWIECTDDNVFPPPPPPPPGPPTVGPVDPPLPSSGIGAREVAAPVVTTVASGATAGVTGYTTYRLSLQLNPSRTRNIYTIFGEVGARLAVPAAYQAASPFGADIGGTYPQFWAMQADSQYDSWLTVGSTEGNADNALSSIGIAFDIWTTQAGIDVDDGAVFLMDPDTGPSGSVVVAQLTVADGTDFVVTMGAQGRSPTTGDDWQDDNNVFCTGTCPGVTKPPAGGGH